jgi:hypothetical protein
MKVYVQRAMTNDQMTNAKHKVQMQLQKKKSLSIELILNSALSAQLMSNLL